MSSDEEPRARAMAAAAAASNTSSGGVAAGGGGGGGGSGGGGGGNGCSGGGGGGGGGDDEAAAKAVQRRYEGLVTVRAKAVKGKGAWYWAHLDPILVHDADRRARAVKLRCMLCNSLFSASNPSRTASEHLKRGTCPNFNFALPLPPGPAPVPVSVQPLAAAPPPSVGGTSRKRGHGHGHGHGGETPGSSSAGALVLSGGKEDLGALAMLDDTVKKLRSPKGGSPGQPLSRAQVDTALNLLADWLYESCGAVSLSCVEHPKFRSFLAQVGLPPVSRKFLAGAKLDAKFQEVRADSDAKLRDALFFQLSAHGWSSSGSNSGSGSSSSSRSEAGGGPERLVNVTLNLPNGTSLFRRAVFAQGPVGAGDVEDVLSEALEAACGAAGPPERCVGVVADATDRGSARALAELERRHAWMVNLKCQFQAFQRLVKDLCKHCPLVRAAASDCLKLAAFFNNSGGGSSHNNYHCYKGNCSSSSSSSCSLSTQLHKIHLPELQHGTSGLDVVAMMEDVMGAARALHVSLMDDSFKAEDAVAREAAELVRSVRFWTDLEAALQLVRIAKSFAVEVESERPLVGQCLPLWDELRAKIREWCSKFGAEEATVLQIVDKRFVKNYHPAWAAAFILDPLYLIRDSGGKYLPPFQLLRPDQEKDVDRLITRMVSREEAPIAVMELMKWRSEGLDPLYAQAVQVKQRDPVTGKMRIANPQSSRLVWETCLSEFKTLGKVAVRLIFLHATSCGLKCNWSFMRWVYAHGHSRAAMDKVQKMIFIASHARLERRDFANDQDKDAELFANGDEDVLNEVFTEPSSTV